MNELRHREVNINGLQERYLKMQEDYVAIQGELKDMEAVWILQSVEATKE